MLWRCEHTGHRLTSEELVRATRTGYRPVYGMKTWDIQHRSPPSAPHSHPPHPISSLYGGWGEVESNGTRKGAATTTGTAATEAASASSAEAAPLQAAAAAAVAAAAATAATAAAAAAVAAAAALQ